MQEETDCILNKSNFITKNVPGTQYIVKRGEMTMNINNGEFFDF
jgi:hypothetical protein